MFEIENLRKVINTLELARTYMPADKDIRKRVDDAHVAVREVIADIVIERSEHRESLGILQLQCVKLQKELKETKAKLKGENND